MTPARDEAREDMARYHKALIANRHGEAVRIEQKYELYGYPPAIVSIGLHAAAEGKDHLEAVDEYVNGEES